jgi:RNA polymerase sigma factor (sigma-70 family)
VTTIQPSPEHVPSASDEVLLEAVRNGSTGSFGVLYARYRSYALAVARSALPRAESGLAEDVVEAAFARVLSALRNGKGPTDTLQHYVVTVVRREAWRALERQRRQRELAHRLAAGVPAGEDPGGSARRAGALVGSHLLLVTAFRGLPERWRQVLWLTEVEGRKPADVGELMGLSAGSAAALAYRARRGLATAYVEAHQSGRVERCAMPTAELVAYLTARRAAERCGRVQAHLGTCSSCRDLCRGIDTMQAPDPRVAPAPRR